MEVTFLANCDPNKYETRLRTVNNEITIDLSRSMQRDYFVVLKVPCTFIFAIFFINSWVTFEFKR
jgi:hypothetical protein